MKTFPEKRKILFLSLNLKSQIFAQSSSVRPELPSWLLLQLLLLNEVALHCTDECFIHKQEGDLSL